MGYQDQKTIQYAFHSVQSLVLSLRSTQSSRTLQGFSRHGSFLWQVITVGCEAAQYPPLASQAPPAPKACKARGGGHSTHSHDQPHTHPVHPQPTNSHPSPTHTLTPLPIQPSTPALVCAYIQAAREGRCELFKPTVVREVPHSQDTRRTHKDKKAGRMEGEESKREEEEIELTADNQKIREIRTEADTIRYTAGPG